MITSNYTSKRMQAIETATMHKLTTSRNQDNIFIRNAEKQAIAIFNPLQDYKEELIEIYKTILLEIGIDYNTYLSRHNSTRGN